METEMKNYSLVLENTALEINVSKYLEVFPLPSIFTGTQDEQHKEIKYSHARGNCENSVGTKHVWDKYEELLTEDEIEMKKSSPVSKNVTLEMNVSKCLEVVPLPLIGTEIQYECHEQMEDSYAMENYDNLVGIKHEQEKCEEMCNET